MIHRTLDEMVSYFNQQVSEMDIDQSYKIQLLGMVSALAYGVQKPHWIPCSERLPEEYGEYRITWTTSASKHLFIGDAEYEITSEWDDERNDWVGKWLLDDYITAYPDVKVIAWKPLEEPYKEEGGE